MDVAVTDNPYPGLRPFQADETHLFFGRDEQRIDLLHRLRRSRFLAIVGTSGSGKSSLVRAGLLPGLHGGFMAGATDKWRIVDMRPGTDAMGNLARALDAPGALRDEPPAEDEPSFTEATLRRSGLGLVDAVREARLPDSEKVLVLVDQFEELFRAIEATDRPQSSDDAAAFVKLLLEAAKQDEIPIYIVLTMRTDFLGECARFRDLPEAINDGQYLVPRQTRDQRLEAITGPAAVFGVTLSSTLVNRLLNDVGDNPDQLPILQHALMRSWACSCRESEIGLSDYETVGGMGNALSLHADAVYESLGGGLTPAKAARRKAIAERLFKSLAAIGAGGLPIRRLARLREIADTAGAAIDEVVSVIDAFRAPGNSFLMPPAFEPLTPETYIDISHESLIRNWTRMKNWVEEEVESARVYERLSQTAALHAKGQAALWNDPDLAVALKWRAEQKPNAAWAQRYNTSFEQAMQFLDASQRQAHEAEDAKAHRRRVWTFTLALAFFAMVFGTVTWWNDELARADELSRKSQQAREELDVVTALAEARNAHSQGAAGAAAFARTCARPHADSAGHSPGAILRKLCRNELADEDWRLVGAYVLVAEGRWRDASDVISRLDEPAMSQARRVLDQLATMRSPTDRAERKTLVETYGRMLERAPYPDRAKLASMVHPVHRRIGHTLHENVKLTREEELLLQAYAEAERGRLFRGTDARVAAREKTEELSRAPHGHSYAELAKVAVDPESKLLENVQTAMVWLDEWGAAIVIFLIWPAWRLLRFVQRRRGKVISPRPHGLRRTVAGFFDLVIAIGLGAAVATFIEAVIKIAVYVLRGKPAVDLIEAIALVAAVVAITSYFLLRDAIKLKFRRSLGKAMFSLRPLVDGGSAPGAVTARVSMKRNALPAGFWAATFAIISVTSAVESISGVVGAVAILLMLALLVVDGVRAWLKDRRSFGDKWSGTKVIDSDCAESLAVRP